MGVDFSADFTSAITELNEILSDTLNKLQGENSEAKAAVGSHLNRLSSILGTVTREVLPGNAYYTCSKCYNKVFVETAFWSGTCYQCAFHG